MHKHNGDKGIEYVPDGMNDYRIWYLITFIHHKIEFIELMENDLSSSPVHM